MKRQLNLVFQDIRNGRNLETYITIGVATIVALLSILGIYHPKVISAVTLMVLAAVSYSLLQDRRSNIIPVTICNKNDINMNYIFQYIGKHKTKKARLIQYSGYMARQVIEKLLEEGATVELLLQHSGCALNDLQKNKIMLFKEAIVDLPNKRNLTVKYYKESASMRGIKLDDDFLSVGWYIYRNQENSDPNQKTSNEGWLYGHNNAAINIHLYHASTECRDLVDTFDRTFKALWESAEP